MTENELRKEWARSALENHAQQSGPNGDDEDDLCDLLTDLLHLFGGEVFDGRLEMARIHYDEEVNDGNEG